MIQANLLVAKQDVAGEIFNIGAGLPITLTNLAKLILKLTHKKHLKIKYTVPRPGDILHSYADISKANRLLKFEPKYNQEKGLEDYFKWFDQKYGTNLTLN